MEVEKIGTCVTIHMKLGENRLNPDFISAFHDALDKAEAYDDATAVVTIGEGKYYSLGLDLAVLSKLSAMEIQLFGDSLQKLFLRILTFPLVTVAAINGHVYAAGVFIALAHDYKVMRSDRGWWCLNEIHIRRNFSVGLLEMARALLPQQQLRFSVVLGKRYSGDEAKASGIVDDVSPLHKLKTTSIAAATKLAGKDGLDRRTLTTLKHDLYRNVVQALREPVRMYSLL